MGEPVGAVWRRELPTVGGGGFRNGHIIAIDSMITGTMMTEESGHFMDSEEFWEGVRRVGPGSEFRYRCIFDPTPVIRNETLPGIECERRSEEVRELVAIRVRRSRSGGGFRLIR